MTERLSNGTKMEEMCCSVATRQRLRPGAFRLGIHSKSCIMGRFVRGYTT